MQGWVKGLSVSETTTKNPMCIENQAKINKNWLKFIWINHAKGTEKIQRFFEAHRLRAQSATYFVTEELEASALVSKRNPYWAGRSLLHSLPWALPACHHPECWRARSVSPIKAFVSKYSESYLYVYIIYHTALDCTEITNATLPYFCLSSVGCQELSLFIPKV